MPRKNELILTGSPLEQLEQSVKHIVKTTPAPAPVADRYKMRIGTPIKMPVAYSFHADGRLTFGADYETRSFEMWGGDNELQLAVNKSARVELVWDSFQDIGGFATRTWIKTESGKVMKSHYEGRGGGVDLFTPCFHRELPDDETTRLVEALGVFPATGLALANCLELTLAEEELISASREECKQRADEHQAKLKEMEDCRRRAAAEAHTYIIG